MTKICLFNFNGVLDALAFRIRKDLVKDWHDADVLVMWQDVIGDMESIASQAKAQGKRVIVAEHGFLSINDYIPPLNRPLVADVFMAWGNFTKDWLVTKAGIDPTRIMVTGTPIVEKMIPRRRNHTPRILFAPRHWLGEMQENLDVAQELKKCKYEVFSKLLEGENNPQNYPHPLSTDRQGLNHIETCFQVLSWADVVVGIGEGTFGALAHLMDIPYISVDHWETKDLLGKTYDRKEFKSQITKTAIQCNLQSLNAQIEDVINHPEFGGEEREWFRKECLDYPGDPIKKMTEVIFS